MTAIRLYRTTDARALNAVALRAFGQYRDQAGLDWPAMARGVSAMAELAEVGQLMVAEHDGRLCGGVAYLPVAARKAEFFDPDWPIIRMLVVDPTARNLGLGRLLTQACIDRAIAEGAPAIALHTTPIMAAALALYLRMGFERRRDAPDLFGQSYGVYVRQL